MLLLGTLVVGLMALALFAGAVVGLRRLARKLGAEDLASELPPHLARALEEHAPLPSERTAAPRTSTACPRCASALAETRGAYDERRCPRACGALLPLTGSERLLERAGLDAEVVRALVGEQGAKKGTCPSCEAAMHEGRLRGVLVDLCLSCGALWLDDGEIDKLTNARAFEEVA